MGLTKNDIAKRLYNLEGLDLTRQEADDIVKAVFNMIIQGLEQDGSILISGFGKWEVKDKKARKGRNPQTGEEIIIDEKRVVTFKPSIKLRDLLNGRE